VGSIGKQFTAESSRVLSKFHPENKKLIKQALDELRKNPHKTLNFFAIRQFEGDVPFFMLSKSDSQDVRKKLFGIPAFQTVSQLTNLHLAISL
jgi:hypothetical protein